MDWQQEMKEAWKIFFGILKLPVLIFKQRLSQKKASLAIDNAIKKVEALLADNDNSSDRK